MFLHKLLAFLKKDLLIALNYRFSFFLEVLGIFFSTTAFYFLSRIFGPGISPHLAPYGNNYFAFVLIGIALSSYLSFSLYSFSAQLRESQVQGTLEALLVTNTRLSTIVLLSSIYPLLYTSLSVLIYLILGATVFGFSLHNANILGALIILTLSVTSFSGIGILSAAFIMVFKRGSPIQWLVASLSYLLSGTLYPVSVLPDWLQKISLFLPLTYSLHGMRSALLLSHSLKKLVPDIIALVLFTAVLLPAGLAAFGYATSRAKQDGSLTQY